MDSIGNFFAFLWAWIVTNHGKIIWLAIVLVVSIIAEHVLTRMLGHTLHKAKIPNASIFINILRVLIVLVAIAIVLRPVFGISPMSVFTALGIGGFAISLGLKDSVANTIGGFELMFSHVIQPGDIVNISGTTGVVQDINWRQTIVQEANGNQLMIPNSVLNTTALEKINPVNRQTVTVPFTAKPGVDANQLTQDLLQQVNHAAGALLNPNKPPAIQFTGFSQYGITGQITATAAQGGNTVKLVDAITRSISQSDLLQQLSASASHTN